jgi:hypothetical protein
MSERKSLIERVRDAGQAIVAVSMVAGILGGVAVKAWGALTAGLEAKSQVASVEVRVGRIERQMKFVVFAAEKATKISYKDWARDHRRHEDDDER